jgi:hypothetical protein
MQQYQLKQFDPQKANSEGTWLIIGPRNTGKSVLLLDLLYRMRKNFDFGFAVVGSVGAYKNIRKVLPQHFVYNGYDEQAIENYSNALKAVNAQEKRRRGLLIEDDLFSQPAYLKTPTQNDIYLNGRHTCRAKITLCQYLMFLPPHVRNNVEYVIALREPIVKNRAKLYEYFFGSFPSQKEFNRVFDQCTRDYKCLVLDKTQTSGKLEDSIMWYKADPNVPKFSFGRQIYFRLSWKIFEENERKRATQRQTNLKTITV